jgi:hypothetical protein
MVPWVGKKVFSQPEFAGFLHPAGAEARTEKKKKG